MDLWSVSLHGPTHSWSSSDAERLATEQFPEDEAMNPGMVQIGVNVLDGMVRRMEKGGRIEVGDGLALVQVLQVFGERSEQEGHIVAHLEKALRQKRATDFVREARELSSLLRSHLQDSESPTSQTSLPAHIEVTAHLSKLERKYAVKSTGDPLQFRARTATT